MRTRSNLHLLAVVALVPLLALAACGGDDGAGVRDGDAASASGSGAASGSGTASDSAEPACEPVGDPAEATSTVSVLLEEWKVVPDATEIPAGTVAFEAENAGEEAHELLIVRADGIGALPTKDDGSIDEDAIAEDDLIGEIHPFPAGETCTGVFDLTPGGYVLLCAIVETAPDGTQEDHFHEGMAVELTVT